MGLESDENSPDIEKASILLSQLPRESRIARVLDRDLEWSIEAMVLRQIEYDIRCLIYSLGDGKDSEPSPMSLPSEISSQETAIESALAVQEELQAAFFDSFPKN